MPFARRRLRWRLALEFTLIAAAIHALVALATVLLRDRYYDRLFDTDLRERAELIATTLSRGSEGTPEAAFEKAVEAVELVRPGRTALVEVRDAEGRLLATTDRDSRLPFAGDRRGPLEMEGSSIGRPGDRYRMVSIAGARGGKAFYIQDAESLAEITAAKQSLRTLFLLVLPGVMLGTGLAAWLIADRAMRRIDRVAAALRAMRAGEPPPRIEAGGEGDEIGEMVGEMNGMLARLEAAFRAQERFIINVTHELKTPVSVMLAQAQMLKGQAGEAPAAYREFAVSVEEEMRRLGALLEGFLTLARSGQGQRYLESSLVSLNEVIVESIRRAGPAAAEKQVSLVPTLGECGEDEPLLRGDGELLTTALTNLVRNAVEHSPPGAPVDITMEAESGDCRVVVSHRMERDETGAVLAFARPGRKRTRELAMEVARGIAQLHGGDIWTEEDQQQGVVRALMRVPLAPVTVEA